MSSINNSYYILTPRLVTCVTHMVMEKLLLRISVVFRPVSRLVGGRGRSQFDVNKSLCNSEHPTNAVSLSLKEPRMMMVFFSLTARCAKGYALRAVDPLLLLLLPTLSPCKSHSGDGRKGPGQL